eukprot:1229422-Rhodomonas_salina.1
MHSSFLAASDSRCGAAYAMSVQYQHAPRQYEYTQALGQFGYPHTQYPVRTLAYAASVPGTA